MPEAISRSSVSQIASYGPPEELSSQAPKVETKTAAPTQSSAESMPLEKADKKQMSYEKCIAQHEREAQRTFWPAAAAGGCAMVIVPGMAAGFAIAKGPGMALGGAIGCLGGALKEGVGSLTQGTALGTTEGKIACDDLPKKQ